MVALQQEDYETAAELLESAANYRYLAGDYLGEANSSNTLGDVYMALGRDNNAIGAYRVALRAGAEADARALQLRAIDGLLEIYFERQAWQTVLEYLNQRRELTLAATEPDVQTAVTLRWLGDYYSIQGDVTAAEQAYSRGLGLARLLENPALEAEFDQPYPGTLGCHHNKPLPVEQRLRCAIAWGLSRPIIQNLPLGEVRVRGVRGSHPLSTGAGVGESWQ